MQKERIVEVMAEGTYDPDGTMGRTVRVVIEEPCEHGRTEIHKWLGPAGSQYPAHRCPGGSRRVLDPGSFVDLVAAVLHDHGAVKAASGNWVDTPTAEGCPRAEAHFGSAQRIWDTLAGGEQP